MTFNSFQSSRASQVRWAKRSALPSTPCFRGVFRPAPAISTVLTVSSETRRRPDTLELALRRRRQTGSALFFTLSMSAVGLTILAGALAWSSSSAKQTDRANHYIVATAAAEAATEKVISKVSSDFIYGGESLVLTNLSSYQQTYPSSAVSPYWQGWEFSDANGNVNSTYVRISSSSNYVVLNSAYSGLQGFVTTCTIVANARQPGAINDVTGAVYQELQLARIPIFQFAMYTSGDMEISCGQPFTLSGRVHSNGQLYVEPDSTLTFLDAVTAVRDILFQRAPLDSRAAPSGSVSYAQPDEKVSHVNALTLPIGMSNSPIAVREITQPPPVGEDPNSPLGRQRYFNESDVLLTVINNTNFTLTSGRFNNFATTVTNSQVSQFVCLTNTFWDEREQKYVLPIDFNVGAFKDWSVTNGTVRKDLGDLDVSSVYVWDRRPASSTTLGAVRVFNGRQLPGRGLTIATASPLYVWGNYNQPVDANLGTTNTLTTLPASLAGDAITILSTNWSDGNSHLALASRPGKPTTVNAAILAGAVDTTQDHYGGGMENFPRFLESWGKGNPFTYNGSMVKMFPSLYATNFWGTGNVYAPPARNWAYDPNFDNSTKLPPLTPGLLKTIRSVWAAVAPNKTTPPTAGL